MKNSMNRREFARLTAVAFGGLAAGAFLSGCSKSPQQSAGSVAATNSGTADAHACKGLNGCEGQGADGKNKCAGQGGCATASMHHECKGHNECKGQGGCGENPGANACKGQGGCAVPMKNEDGWQKARAAFEQKMKDAGKPVGASPN